MIFKPRKQQIHVPGHGVVQKEDFTQDHFNILMKRAGGNRDAFIKQHFVVASYEDMPIFEENKLEPAAPKAEKKQGKKKAEKSTDEEELARLIAEEEAANKKEKQSE